MALPTFELFCTCRQVPSAPVEDAIKALMKELRKTAEPALPKSSAGNAARRSGKRQRAPSKTGAGASAGAAAGASVGAGVGSKPDTADGAPVADTAEHSDDEDPFVEPKPCYDAVSERFLLRAQFLSSLLPAVHPSSFGPCADPVAEDVAPAPAAPAPAAPAAAATGAADAGAGAPAGAPAGADADAAGAAALLAAATADTGGSVTV